MDLSQTDQGLSLINYIHFQILLELTKSQLTEKLSFGLTRAGTVKVGSNDIRGWALL